MKKRLINGISLLFVSVMSFSCSAHKEPSQYQNNDVSLAATTESDIFAFDPINTDNIAKNYYASISSDLEGDELKLALYNLIHPKKCSTGYKAIWDYLPYCDADPSNPNASNNIVGFYRDETGSKNEMNKEHVWPKSRGGASIEGDPHMVRPTFTKDNSDRGNAFFNEKPASYDPGSLGKNKYRGIAARIIFYCAVQEYKSLTLVDKSTDSTTSTTTGTMGKLSTLLKWNLEYPIDDTEILRNEVLSGARTVKGQSFNFNRNPFIDDRSLPCRIWGDTNETTRTVCSKYMEVPELESLSISPSNVKLTVAATTQLKAVANPSRASNVVTWSSSDPNIVSITQSGLITAHKEGVVTIKAVSDVNKSIEATTTVTVRTCQSLSLSGTPNKVVYSEGERFNPTGLVVKAIYSDGEQDNIDVNNLIWKDGVTGLTTLSQGTTKVVGYYGNLSVIYEGIQVNEASAVTESDYQIKFKDNGSDDGTPLSGAALNSYIEQGTDYISSFGETSSLFKGKYGVKMGSSSKNGKMVINLSESAQVKAKSVTLGLAQYKASEGGSITFNNESPITPTSDTITEYKIDLNDVDLDSITLVSNKRCYLSYIKVECINEGGVVTPPVDDDEISSVQFTNIGDVTIKVGETVQMQVTTNPSNVALSSLVFTTDDPTVATISNTGLVTACGAGDTFVKVATKDGRYYDFYSINVIENIVKDDTKLDNCAQSSANIFSLLALLTICGVVIFKKK